MGSRPLTPEEAAAMFIQVIQGEVADAEGLRAAMDRWEGDLQPGAVAGWALRRAASADWKPSPRTCRHR
jgi:hypothetical protein